MVLLLSRILVHQVGVHGHQYDFSIMKDNHNFIIQPDVAAGSQAVFLVKPILSFGVVSNLETGETFESSQITSDLFPFDLSEFPNGMEVTLNREPGGGRYYFTSRALFL